MGQFVKQSTAVVVSFGAFVDKTDGVSLEIGLVSALDHGTTGIKLSKNGGALTIRHATVTATTYDAYGNYRVTLDTTDTNTLGTLRMQFSEEATCLPVWMDFMVLPANVYDSLVGGSDALDVSLIQWLGTAPLALSSQQVQAVVPATQKVDVETIKTNPVVNAGTITFPTTATLASTTNITAGTITTVTTVTNQLTAAQVATGVWQDATAGDFTTASSIGKCLYIANVAPGGTGGHFISGTNSGSTTVGNFIVSNAVVFGGNFDVSGSTTLNGLHVVQLTVDSNAMVWNSAWDAEVQSECADALTAFSTSTLTAAQVRTELATELARIDVATSTRMATYTQPTGFLSATFPATVAAVGDIPTAAQIATAWGASVVGNGRTRDYFLQGATNKVVRTATTFVLYSTDDLTPLMSAVATQDGSLDPLASIDPT